MREGMLGMGELRFSPSAARDLQKIADDIAAAAGARVALDFVGRLRQSLETLADHPGAGRRRTELGLDVRSWAVTGIRRLLSTERRRRRDHSYFAWSPEDHAQAAAEGMHGCAGGFRPHAQPIRRRPPPAGGVRQAARAVVGDGVDLVEQAFVHGDVDALHLAGQRDSDKSDSHHRGIAIGGHDF